MSRAIQKYNETCFKEFAAYYKLRKNHCGHIKYIKCWYKLAVVKESGWGHCWKALWKEWVWRRRRRESHLRWNSLEDLSGPDTNSSAWGEFYPSCWRKITSHLKRSRGKEEKRETGWTGRKGFMVGIEGAFEDQVEETIRRKGEIIWMYGTAKWQLSLIWSYSRNTGCRWYWDGFWELSQSRAFNTTGNVEKL